MSDFYIQSLYLPWLHSSSNSRWVLHNFP